MNNDRFDHTEVVVPSLNTRFSGVTATVIALLPIQRRFTNIAAIGPNLPDRIPRIRWLALVRAWTPPEGTSARIWHARRNNEMLAGILLAKGLRQPWKLVFTSAAQRRHTRFTRFLIRRMDAVISTSPQAASYLEIPSTIIAHGVDTKRYHPHPDRDAAWAESGLPGRFGIGVFGRVRRQKGTDLFVQAMCRLLPAHTDWTAVVIGLVKPEDARFAADLKRRIAAADLTERIRFLGEQPVEAVPDWLRRLSLVAVPARWEGFGLVPLEAMASATPVVASRAGAAGALVVDDVTGRLVPVDDEDALCRALDAIMTMAPEERAEMGRAARQHAETAHSIVAEAAAIQAVYDTLLRPDQPVR